MHLAHNIFHIKTIIVDKDNPQRPGDLKKINKIINTSPIGVAGRKHAIISNIKAIAKDVMLKEKEIKSLKELVTQRKLTREMESTRVPLEKLRKIKPLKERMIIVKQAMINEVMTMLDQFIGGLQRVAFEEQKLKDIVTERVSLLRILESQKPMIVRFEMTQNQRPEDAKFCEDYWFYLGVIHQIATHFQKVQKEVDMINDKANTSL